MRRVLSMPAQFGRFAWSFINPSRSAGQLPWGRVAIVTQIIVALVFIGYTLTKKSIRLPFSEAPYQVEVELKDAQGLDRVDEPAAGVAGTLLGRVTDTRYEDGIAVVTLTFEPEVRGKIFADASAVVRPASAIQNLTVNVYPGNVDTGPLPDDERITLEKTSGFVTIDDLTSVLNADTQAYVQILVGEAQRALRGRESELRAALAELGELADLATPISRTLARRRVLLERLVGHLDTVVTTLAERRGQLAESIDAGNRTLAVTAARAQELADVTRELAPTLVQANRSIAALRALAVPLVPALDTLIPTLPALTDGLRSLRELIPVSASLIDDFEALTTEGEEPLNLLLEATEGLDRKARGLVPTAEDLSSLARLLDRFKEGSAQTADTLSGALSASDNGGVYGQIDVLKFEPPKPENFGVPAAMAGARGAAGPSELELALARALERVCVQSNPWACVARFNVPGLPAKPVSAGKGGGG